MGKRIQTLRASLLPKAPPPKSALVWPSYASSFGYGCLTTDKDSRQLQRTQFDSIHRLLAASELRDEETGAHMRRVGAYARVLAEAIGLEEWRQDLIERAAPLHDVGKIGLPDSVLRKSTSLTKEEFELVKRHTLLGAKLLEGSESPYLETARLIALTHHERWDGSGYPNGLKGEEIPLEGRIVMLADCYDALRSKRPYKPSFPHRKACRLILQGDDRSEPGHFDPLVLKAFQSSHDRFARAYATTRGGSFWNVAGSRTGPPAPSERGAVN